MGFFTKLPLNDIQVKQLSGDTLTLSGTTNILGILKSKNIEIDATVSGASASGHVLTYIGGKIQLQPPTGGGETDFDSARATTRSGIPAVNVGGATVTEFLEGYFFPSVAPAASISGGGTRMFGNNAIVNLSFTATRNTLPIQTITLDGVSVPVVDGNTQSGTSGKTLTTPNTNQTFTLLVTDTNGASDSASTTITFRHKRYYYGDNQNLIGQSDTDISNNVNLNETSGQAEFATSRVKSTFSVSLASQFFYYVIPASFGTPSFVINGLSNTDFSSQTFTFTNPNGYSESFVVWRTNNLLTGNFNFSVA